MKMSSPIALRNGAVSKTTKDILDDVTVNSNSPASNDNLSPKHTVSPI